MRRLTRSSFVLALLGAGLLALAGCGGGKEPAASAAEEKPLAVGSESVYRVTTARLATGPLISGSLEAEKEATVAAEVPGAVLAAAAEEGTPVAAGTLLARIDDRAQRESVLSAQSAVRSADQQVTVAKRNAERAEALLEGGAIAERDAEVARWNVTNAQAALADARSRLTFAREQLAKTAVHAPFRGVVSKKSVTPGDTVQPGTPLYTVVDPTRMRLVAHVPADGIAGLQIGTPVEFVVGGLRQPALHRHRAAHQPGGRSDDAAGGDPRRAAQRGRPAPLRPLRRGPRRRPRCAMPSPCRPPPSTARSARRR